jgi:hypothetical protein
LLYLAWRFGGADPYRLFHGLDENYVPFGGGLPIPPPSPSRLRHFIYGCAMYAQEQEAVMHDKKITRKKA